MKEWHYFADQFDSKETGEHGWRKSNTKPGDNILARESTHRANANCHKLCRDGLWPIPAELVTASPPVGHSPFGYTKEEFAEAWYVTENGRVFKLIRHNGRTANLVVEIAYKEHQPYAWIPNYPKTRVWEWIGIQTKEGY
jgi:hypothetical protein